MESNLENIVDSMMQQDKVVGVLVADSQGLTYASKLSFFWFSPFKKINYR